MELLSGASAPDGRLPTMTRLQELEIRSSEVRERLNELAGADELTEAEAKEATDLTAEFRQVEAKRRAALAAADEAPKPEESGEQRERAELRDRASVGEVFAAAVEHREAEGATAELQQERGIAPNAVPLELLREQRAVTPAPTDTGAVERMVIPAVFATGDAAFLGFEQPTVPAGDAVFPVITTRPTVGGPHTDSASVAETTGAFTADTLAPGRVQASFFYRRTDATRFRGMSDALRASLSAGLSEAVDAKAVAQVVSDSAQAASGSSAWDLPRYRKALVDQLDGRYCSMESEVRFLMGAATAADADALTISNTSETALEMLRRRSGGVKVSAHIAAVASTKQDMIVVKGNHPGAVAPMWEGVTLIPDELTKAGTGEIVITALLMAAFKVVRTDGFVQQSIKHS